MILASILLGPLSLSPMVKENIASLKHFHHGIPHRLFRDNDVIELLEARFPREVLGAFRALRPAAYKADLARYCIIHEFGGIYADLSHFFVRPVPFDRKRPTVFRELFGAAPWDANNSVFAAPAGHKAIGRAIELVCANVQSGYYGPSPLCPTGPSLFGKALAGTCAAEELNSGLSAVHTLAFMQGRFPKLPLPTGSLIHCLEIDQRITVVRRKRQQAPGLGDLGIAGSDNYLAQWKSRDIYEQVHK